MQPEVKTDPVLATAGSAVATEQKDIEAHFYFPCASISFLSVLGQTDKWTMTINSSRIFQLKKDSIQISDQIFFCNRYISQNT